MSQTISTPEGCKYGETAGFLHPSAAPFIDIYQAGAQRTIGAVVPERLIHCIQCSRTTSDPLHRLHPSSMSQIALFDLAGGHDPYVRLPGPHGTRALHTGDTTSRVTTEARGAGLHGTPPLHAMHPVRDTQASHQNALPRLGRSKWSAA